MKILLIIASILVAICGKSFTSNTEAEVSKKQAAPIVWKTARVGSTKIILDAPGSFVPNKDTRTIYNDEKFTSYKLMSETEAFNLSEHFNKDKDYKLSESVEMYLKRLQSKFPGSFATSGQKFHIQGCDAQRLNGTIMVNGTPIQFVWIGFYNQQFAWVFEAHFVNTEASKAKVDRVLNSIKISQIDTSGPSTPTRANEWRRTRVGSTHITVMSPSQFIHDVRSDSRKNEGLVGMTSYYSFYSATNNAFLIVEARKIKGYDSSLRDNAEKILDALKKKSFNCNMSSRNLVKVAGKEGNVTFGEMNLNGVKQGFIYYVFQDAEHVWVAQAFYEISGLATGEGINNANKFLSSIQILEAD